MKYGFSFNNIHSNSIDGLTVKTVSRPITPEMRDNKFIVPHADGAVFTATANPLKRPFYETRVFTISMMLRASGILELTKKLAKISEWLTGTGTLKFDDTPLVAWEATGVSSIDYAPERRGTKAVMSVSFEVQPFGHLPWSVADGPMLGQDYVYLGDSLPIGEGSNFYMVMTGSQVELEVLNYGSHYAQPVITVKTTGTEKRIGAISVIANGDAKMNIYTSGDTMIADCKRHILTDGDNKNIMTGDTASIGFSGQFIELRPGVNTLKFQKSPSATSANLEITVDYIPNTIWDFDFDSIEWGDQNA